MQTPNIEEAKRLLANMDDDDLLKVVDEFNAEFLDEDAVLRTLALLSCGEDNLITRIGCGGLIINELATRLRPDPVFIGEDSGNAGEVTVYSDRLEFYLRDRNYPLILKKDYTMQIKSFDQDDKKWYETVIVYNGTDIDLEDVDRKSPVQGLKWNDSPTRLLNPELYKF